MTVRSKLLLWTLISMLMPRLTRVEDVTVRCVERESCTLPCSFTPDPIQDIHWVQGEGDIPVHSYYEGKDQSFNNRRPTSLLLNQSTGNASLLLPEVQVQDQGRYKCTVNTIGGRSKSVIDLVVIDTETTPSSGLPSALKNDTNQNGNSTGDEDNPGEKGILFWVGVVVVVVVAAVVVGVGVGVFLAKVVDWCKKKGQRRNNQPGAATDVEMEHFNPDRPTPDGHNGVNAL